MTISVFSPVFPEVAASRKVSVKLAKCRKFWGQLHRMFHPPRRRETVCLTRQSLLTNTTERRSKISMNESKRFVSCLVIYISKQCQQSRVPSSVNNIWKLSNQEVQKYIVKGSVKLIVWIFVLYIFFFFVQRKNWQFIYQMIYNHILCIPFYPILWRHIFWTHFNLDVILRENSFFGHLIFSIHLIGNRFSYANVIYNIICFFPKRNFASDFGT